MMAHHVLRPWTTGFPARSTARSWLGAPTGGPGTGAGAPVGAAVGTVVVVVGAGVDAARAAVVTVVGVIVFSRIAGRRVGVFAFAAGVRVDAAGGGGGGGRGAKFAGVVAGDNCCRRSAAYCTAALGARANWFEVSIWSVFACW